MGKFEIGTSMSDPRTATMLRMGEGGDKVQDMDGPGVEHVRDAGVHQGTAPWADREASIDIGRKFPGMSKADRQVCELMVKELMHKEGCSADEARRKVYKAWNMESPATGQEDTHVVAKARDEAVSRKIKLLMEEGKPQDQAVAIALDMQRRGKLSKGYEDEPTQRVQPGQPGDAADAFLAQHQPPKPAAPPPTPQQQNVQQVQQFHQNIKRLGLTPPPADKGAPYHGSDEWRQYHERVHDRAHKYAEGRPEPSRFRLSNVAFEKWHADHVGDNYEHTAVKNRVPGGGPMSSLPPAPHPAHVGSPAHHHAISRYLAGQTTPGGPPASAVAGHEAAVAHRDAEVARYREGRRAGKQPKPPPTLDEARRHVARRQSWSPAIGERAARATGRGTAETHPVSASEREAAIRRVAPYKKSETAMMQFEALGWVDLAEDNIRKSLAMEVGQLGIMPDNTIVVKGEDGQMRLWEPEDDEFVPDWVIWMYPDQIAKGLYPEEICDGLFKADEPAPAPGPAKGSGANFGMRSAAEKVLTQGKHMVQQVQEAGRSMMDRRRARQGARAAAASPAEVRPSRERRTYRGKGQMGSGGLEQREKPLATADPRARIAHAAGEAIAGKKARERRATETANMRQHHEALARQIDNHPAWDLGFSPRTDEHRAAVKHFRSKLGAAGGVGEGGIHEHRQVRAHTEASVGHHERLIDALDDHHATRTRAKKISREHAGGHHPAGVAGAAHAALGAHARNLPGSEHLATLSRGKHISPEQADQAAAMIRRHRRTEHHQSLHPTQQRALKRAHDMLDAHGSRGHEHLSAKRRQQYRSRADARHHAEATNQGVRLPRTVSHGRRVRAAQEAAKKEAQEEKAETKRQRHHAQALGDTKRALKERMPAHHHAEIDNMTDLNEAVKHLHQHHWPQSAHSYYDKHEGGQKPHSYGSKDPEPEKEDWEGRAKRAEAQAEHHSRRADEAERRAHHQRLRAEGATHGPLGRESLVSKSSNTIEEWGWVDLVEDTVSKAQAMPEGAVGVLPDGQIIIKEAGYFQPWFPRHPEQVPPWAMYVEPELVKGGPDYHGAPNLPQGKWVIRTPERTLQKSEVPEPEPISHIRVGSVTYINAAPAVVRPEGSRPGLDPIQAPPGVFQD